MAALLGLNWAAPVFGMAGICILVSHDELLNKLYAIHSHGWISQLGAGSAVASDVILSHCAYCNISCHAGDQTEALKHKPVASTTLFCGTEE